MIIWLASYPRSGNTLLRTICKHCFNMYSYADEPVHFKNDFRDNPDLVGHIEHKGPWQEIYKDAQKSSNTVLVKTHLPPVDNQPFIYIIRDGRAAISSYKRFHKNYNNLEVSLVKLILGIDAYGGWTEHYYKWNHRGLDRRLILRFEDLTNISDDMISQIADFIGYKESIRPWRNPLDNLKKTEPNFFAAHESGFIPDIHWSDAVEYLFNMIHGELMLQLKYYNVPLDFNKKVIAIDHMHNVMADFIKSVHDLRVEASNLKEVCEERLALIQKLQNICEERLDLINLLNDQINKTQG
jgi:hypothetical protein